MFDVVPDISVLTNALNYTKIGLVSGILGGIIALITVLSISSDKQHMKTLFFPVLVAWNLIGLKQNVLAIFVSAIIFTLNIFSVQVIGDVIESSGKVVRAIKAVAWKAYDTSVGVVARKQTKAQEKRLRTSYAKEGLIDKMFRKDVDLAYMEGQKYVKSEKKIKEEINKSKRLLKPAEDLAMKKAELIEKGRIASENMKVKQLRNWEETQNRLLKKKAKEADRVGGKYQHLFNLKKGENIERFGLTKSQIEALKKKKRKNIRKPYYWEH